MEFMQRFSAAHPLLLGGASGVLAGLSIAYPFLWLLAPVSLGAFFLVLWHASSAKRAYAVAFLFFLISGGIGIAWFWGTLPLDWMGVDPRFQWYYVLAAWGAVSLAFGISGAAVALLIWAARSSVLSPLIAAFALVVAEEAKMWAFALLTFENHSFMGAHFSATALGYPLAESSYLLQIAEGGGVYTLTFLCALMGAIAAYVLMTPRPLSSRSRAALTLALIALAAMLLSPLMQQKRTYGGESLSVALYASDFALDAPRDTATEHYLEALRAVAKAVPDADLVVLPEDVRLEPSFTDAAEARAAHAAVFGTRDPVIAASDHLLTDQDFSLVLSFTRASGEELGSYSKMFLMPGGEYLPHYLSFAFSLVPDANLEKYAGSLRYRTLPGTTTMSVPVDGWTVSGFICSDFLSPKIFRDARERFGTDLFVNSANPGWFHYSRILHDKVLQISKVHAVQNRAYYLQSTNAAPAFAIDPEGRIIRETPWGFVGPLSVSIP